MIWAYISVRGLCSAAFVSGNQKNEMYTETFQNTLLPSANEHRNKGYVFMQDTARFHRANMTKIQFEHHHLEVLKWKACSHNFNRIENFVYCHFCCVYRLAKHYKSEEQLINVILLQWATNRSPSLVSLNWTLLNRNAAVLQDLGRKPSTVQGTWSGVGAHILQASMLIL